MDRSRIPQGYTPLLNIYETQKAIGPVSYTHLPRQPVKMTLFSWLFSSSLCKIIIFFFIFSVKYVFFSAVAHSPPPPAWHRLVQH